MDRKCSTRKKTRMSRDVTRGPFPIRKVLLANEKDEETRRAAEDSIFKTKRNLVGDAKEKNLVCKNAAAGNPAFDDKALWCEKLLGVADPSVGGMVMRAMLTEKEAKGDLKRKEDAFRIGASLVHSSTLSHLLWNIKALFWWFLKKHFSDFFPLSDASQIAECCGP